MSDFVRYLVHCTWESTPLVAICLFFNYDKCNYYYPSFVFSIFEHDNCNCIFICLPIGTGRVVSVSDFVYPWIILLIVLK